MWEPIWASRFRYWLLTGEVSRSCLHSSRTRRVRTLNVTMTVILWVYMFWCTEGCSESRMWSRTWRGVSKWSRHKDWYIGSLCLDIGSVLGEIGILPGYREVTGTPREPYGPSWALVERRKGQPKGAARLPPSPSPIRTRRGGRPPLSLFPPWES